jgi:hypothetical protein
MLFLFGELLDQLLDQLLEQLKAPSSSAARWSSTTPSRSHDHPL